MLEYQFRLLETPAIQICNRVLRAEAETLFCGRSGLTFEYHVEKFRLCRLIQLATLPLDNMYGSDKIILKKAQSHI